MKDLTRRQRGVLEFIEEFIQEKGFPPSVRDIAARFNLISAAGVHKHIKALVRKGYLTKDDFLSRSLRVVRSLRPPAGGGAEVVELPLAGYVAAGRPIEAIPQNQETLALPATQVGNPNGKYVLQVRGESMIDDGILDGDFVILESRKEAHDGETVVALINGQEATLKRFYREKDRVRLQPANPAVDPIIVQGQELQVQGVVVGLWRRYA